MKKLLMGAIVLSCFAIALSLFQLSCKNDVTAQTGNYVLPPATTTTLGGVIVGSGLSVNNVGVLSVSPGGSGTQLNKVIFKKITNNLLPSFLVEIWMCNYDGTGATKVNITLPGGISFSDDMTPVMSPNGQKIFFTAGATGIHSGDLYSCNLDGTGLTLVHAAGTNGLIILGGAY